MEAVSRTTAPNTRNSSRCVARGRGPCRCASVGAARPETLPTREHRGRGNEVRIELTTTPRMPRVPRISRGPRGCVGGWTQRAREYGGGRNTDCTEDAESTDGGARCIEISAFTGSVFQCFSVSDHRTQTRRATVSLNPLSTKSGEGLLSTLRASHLNICSCVDQSRLELIEG